jgi:hypothetical protein
MEEVKYKTKQRWSQPITQAPDTGDDALRNACKKRQHYSVNKKTMI